VEGNKIRLSANPAVAVTMEDSFERWSIRSALRLLRKELSA
jgi:hypothetical protein